MRSHSRAPAALVVSIVVASALAACDRDRNGLSLSQAAYGEAGVTNMQPGTALADAGYTNPSSRPGSSANPGSASGTSVPGTMPGTNNLGTTPGTGSSVPGGNR